MSAIFDVECIIDDVNPLALAILMRLGPYDDFGYYSFKQLGSATGATRAEVKRAIDELRKHDLVAFASGLTNEDGEFRGSGYAASELGLRLQRILEAASDAESAIKWRLERQAAA